MTEDNKIWLVRSHGQLLGPYSAEEVVQGLKSFKFSIHDEVSEQMGHWLSFTDTEVFKELSFEIQSSYVDDSKTEVSKSLSGVSIPTDIIDGAELEEFRSESNEVATADLKSRIESGYQSNNRRSGAINGSFSGNKGGKTSEVLIFQKSSIIGIALFLVVLVGGYTLLKSQLVIGIGAGNAKKITQLLKTARNQNVFGETQVAISTAEEAYKLNPKKLETIKLYGALLIRSGEIKKALQVLSVAGLENNPEVTNLLGLIELAKNNNFLALKKFNRAIALKDDFYSAMLNKALANLFLGQTKEAFSDLKKLELEFKNYPHLYLLMAETLVKEWESTKEEASLTQAQNILRQNYLMDTIFNQESLIFQLYIDYLLDRSGESFGIKHRNIFDNDINESEKLFFPLDIGLYGTGWDYILSWCDSLSTSLDNVMGRVLISLCRFKSKQPEMAKNLMLEILSESTDSSLLYKSLLLAYSPENKMADIDALINENNNVPIPYSIPHFVKVSKCVNATEQSCLSESVTKPLKSLRPNSLLILSSSAQIKFKEGNYLESKEASLAIERRFPSYRPNKVRLIKIEEYENK